MSETETFEQMRSDHRRVLDRVASLEAVMLGAGGRRGGPEAETELRETFLLMRQQFATHMAAEDEVLFPSLVETLPQARPSVAPLEAEHLELRAMLSRLESTLAEPPRPDRDEQVAVQLRDFIDLLRIHIRKEEALVISVAERVLRPREVQALAARMSQGPRTERGGGPRGAGKE
jgi:hemerythrin-like domain-containing protein